MPHASPVFAPATRRLRAASPAMHGGASSLLRLARPADPRLPSGSALSGWAERAASMLDLSPMMVGAYTQPVQAAPAPHGQTPPASTRVGRA